MQYGFSFRADSIVPLAVETVLYKAHLFRVAAVQHFLHCLVVFWAVVERMDLLELIPVVLKNTLKGFLVNTFRGSPLRTTIAGWAQKSRKNCYIRGFKAPGEAGISLWYRNLYLGGMAKSSWP